MSASAFLQKVIFDALVADVNVGALVADRIYDGMPEEGQYPCITFGDSDFVPDEADCQDERGEAITLHAWSRDQGRRHPCKAIVSAVYDALHEIPLTMQDPYALGEMRVVQARVFLDADRITAHGVIQLEARVEKV